MSTEIQRLSVQELEVVSHRIAESRLFGLDAEQAFTLALMGEAEGLHVGHSVRRWHVIEGRPAMRADAMQAEFQRRGGRVEWIASNAEECRAIFRHPEYQPNGFEVHMTFAEFKASGVAIGRHGVKDNWRKFPAAMLRARVISAGVRAIDPGVVVGIYTPEEIDDFDERETRQKTRVMQASVGAQRGAIETTARVVPPDTRQPNAEEIGDELMGQLNAPRVKDRHAPVEAEAKAIKRHAEKEIDTRRHLAVIDKLCEVANGEWKADCEDYNLDYQPIVNVFQVQNHLGSSAIETKLIAADYLDDANGKRDSKKLVAFLSKWQAKYPDDFYALANAYCANKLGEARTEANLAEYVSDEPAAAAEDESQEAIEAEEVEI